MNHKTLYWNLGRWIEKIRVVPSGSRVCAHPVKQLRCARGDDSVPPRHSGVIIRRRPFICMLMRGPIGEQRRRGGRVSLREPGLNSVVSGISCSSIEISNYAFSGFAGAAVSLGARAYSSAHSHNELTTRQSRRRRLTGDSLTSSEAESIKKTERRIRGQ